MGCKSFVRQDASNLFFRNNKRWKVLILNFSCPEQKYYFYQISKKLVNNYHRKIWILYNLKSLSNKEMRLSAYKMEIKTKTKWFWKHKNYFFIRLLASNSRTEWKIGHRLGRPTCWEKIGWNYAACILPKHLNFKNGKI